MKTISARNVVARRSVRNREGDSREQQHHFERGSPATYQFDELSLSKPPFVCSEKASELDEAFRKHVERLRLLPGVFSVMLRREVGSHESQPRLDEILT